MEQINYTAILTKATDYRENDKLVRLLTLEGGMITAVMKGVKKPKAKLKHASQLFSFGEYQIVTKNGFSTVTGCAIIEDLFMLTKDIDKFLVASVALEAADIAASWQQSPQVFIELLKTLKHIMFSDADTKTTCAAFLSRLLNISGADDGRLDSAPLYKIVPYFQDFFAQKLSSAKLVL